jgi:hypothetical protein
VFGHPTVAVTWKPVDELFMLLLRADACAPPAYEVAPITLLSPSIP